MDSGQNKEGKLVAVNNVATPLLYDNKTLISKMQDMVTDIISKFRNEVDNRLYLSKLESEKRNDERIRIQRQLGEIELLKLKQYIDENNLSARETKRLIKAVADETALTREQVEKKLKELEESIFNEYVSKLNKEYNERAEQLKEKYRGKWWVKLLTKVPGVTEEKVLSDLVKLDWDRQNGLTERGYYKKFKEEYKEFKEETIPEKIEKLEKAEQEKLLEDKNSREALENTNNKTPLLKNIKNADDTSEIENEKKEKKYEEKIKEANELEQKQKQEQKNEILEAEIVSIKNNIYEDVKKDEEINTGQDRELVKIRDSLKQLQKEQVGIERWMKQQDKELDRYKKKINREHSRMRRRMSINFNQILSVGAIVAGIKLALTALFGIVKKLGASLGMVGGGMLDLFDFGGGGKGDGKRKKPKPKNLTEARSNTKTASKGDWGKKFLDSMKGAWRKSTNLVGKTFNFIGEGIYKGVEWLTKSKLARGVMALAKKIPYAGLAFIAADMALKMGVALKENPGQLTWGWFVSELYGSVGADLIPVMLGLLEFLGIDVENNAFLKAVNNLSPEQVNRRVAEGGSDDILGKIWNTKLPFIETFIKHQKEKEKETGGGVINDIRDMYNLGPDEMPLFKYADSPGYVPKNQYHLIEMNATEGNDLERFFIKGPDGTEHRVYPLKPDGTTGDEGFDESISDLVEAETNEKYYDEGKQGYNVFTGKMVDLGNESVNLGGGGDDFGSDDPTRNLSGKGSSARKTFFGGRNKSSNNEPSSAPSPNFGDLNTSTVEGINNPGDSKAIPTTPTNLENTLGKQ